MGNDFYAIVVFVGLAVAFGGGMLVFSIYLPKIIGDVARKRGKLDPYECGVAPAASARVRFSVKFYVVALLFLLFDIETVFLIPWAVAYRDLLAATNAGWFLLGEMLLFIGVLAAGLIYIWRRDALEW